MNLFYKLPYYHMFAYPSIGRKHLAYPYESMGVGLYCIVTNYGVI